MQCYVMLCVMIPGVIALMYYARDLNLLVFGDETAQTTGVNVERSKKAILFLITGLTSTTVAFCGVIGFVGLIIPHAMRWVVGSNHRALIPVAGIGGGILLIWADVLARSLISPLEIPVGIFTALLGALCSFISSCSGRRRERSRNMPLESEGIKFQYGAKVILEEITAHFEQGHLYGILGPNGSGKTTLLKILSGLLRANYGRVTIDNLDLKNLAPAQIAKKIAVVPDLTSLIFDFSVEEIVAMGRYAYVGKFAKETVEDQKIVESILAQFNLMDLKDRSFSQLSAGERQKVIIARAIAQQSKILLLDEPTSPS